MSDGKISPAGCEGLAEPFIVTHAPEDESGADSFVAGPFLLGSQAVDFAASAVVDGKIDEDFVLSELRGKWTVLFFYPLNWTYVCPTVRNVPLTLLSSHLLS